MIVPQAVPLQPVPDTAQVTAVFDVPATGAANCCVDPAVTDTLVGVTVTVVVGTMVTSADSDMVGSATLVTTTLTIAGDGAATGPE